MPFTWSDGLEVIAVASAVPVLVYAIATLMRSRPALMPALKSRLMLFFLVMGAVAALIVYITDSMAREPAVWPRTVAVGVGVTLFMSALAIVAKAETRGRRNSAPNPSRQSRKNATPMNGIDVVASDASPSA